MKPCMILFLSFGQDAELITVMEIQPTQAAYFLCAFQRATDTVDPVGIFLDAFQNPLVGIILTELV